MLKPETARWLQWARCFRSRPSTRGRWRSTRRGQAGASEADGADGGVHLTGGVAATGGTQGGQTALEWLLVSSEGAATAEWAERIVGWYEQRWEIEEYFRLLKTGTWIEDRRLREADALVKWLAFDAIMAWQVFSLARHARDARRRRRRTC